MLVWLSTFNRFEALFFLTNLELFFHDLLWRLNADYRLILFRLLRQGDHVHTVRNRKLGKVQRISYFQINDVDLDILGQILGETAHLELGNEVIDYAALFLAGTFLFIDEMKGHAHVNLLGCDNTQKIHV